MDHSVQSPFQFWLLFQILFSENWIYTFPNSFSFSSEEELVLPHNLFVNSILSRKILVDLVAKNDFL